MRVLWRWIRRRRDGVGRNDVAIGYAGGGTAVGLGMLAATVVEVVVFELLLPWPVARVVLAVLSVVALVVALRVIAAGVVRPHVLDRDGLRVRDGRNVDLVLPLAEIEGVAVRRRDAPRPLHLVDGVATVAHGNQTQLDITLGRETELRVGGHVGPVHTVRISADDPAAARRAIMTTLQRAVNPGVGAEKRRASGGAGWSGNPARPG